MPPYFLVLSILFIIILSSQGKRNIQRKRRKKKNTKTKNNLNDKVILKIKEQIKLYDLGCLLMENGKFKKAERAFRESLNLETDAYLYESNLRLSYTLIQLGKHSQAIPFAEEAIRLNGTTNAYYTACHVHVSEKNFRIAEKYCHRSLEIEPNNYHSHSLMGDILADRKEHNKALKHYEMTYRTEGGHNRDTLRKLGFTLRHLGRREEEFRLYRQAVSEQILPNVWQRSTRITNNIPRIPWYDLEDKNLEKQIPMMSDLFRSIRALEDRMEVIISEYHQILLDTKQNTGSDVGSDVGDNEEYAVDRALYSETPNLWRGIDVYDQGKSISGKKYTQTVAMINASIPMALNYGRLLFSIAQPGLRILPHCGPHNERLTVHCGVQIPSGTYAPWILVAGEKHRWKQGKCIIFDDSFEHEVHYPSNNEDSRVILFFHIPHPVISSGDTKSFMNPKSNHQEL